MEPTDTRVLYFVTFSIIATMVTALGLLGFQASRVGPSRTGQDSGHAIDVLSRPVPD